VKMRILQLQTHVYADRERNLEELAKRLQQVQGEGADLVTVGEMFNCPYETSNFPVYAEEQGGFCWRFCSDLAREHHICLSAGTMPEIDEAGRVYNTAYVFGRDGAQIAKHRKVHLFDIDVTGGQRFRESETLTAGNKSTVFDTEFGRIGLCVCFDIRFPELSRLMVRDGARLILVPAAFNMTTGPAHWDILFRCRAVDNQCFMAGTSPARDTAAGYTAWGHSLIVSPWGDIIQEMDEKEGFIVNEIDFSQADRVREELPLLSARRTDLYELADKAQE